ncbi:MAG: dihydrolipoamide succinyltransferase, partial [Rhodobacterales bacterium]
MPGARPAPRPPRALLRATNMNSNNSSPRPLANPRDVPPHEDRRFQMTDVMVPALGESVSEATVSTWFKKPGDAVKQDEMLCELETDKVSVEVPSPVTGVLAEIIAPEGTTVAANARLAIVTEGAAAPAAKAEPKVEAAAKVGSPGAGPEVMAPRTDVEDAPSAKKAMAEAGLPRDQVQGSGKDGRVMKEDVAGAAAAPAPVAV